MKVQQQVKDEVNRLLFICVAKQFGLQFKTKKIFFLFYYFVLSFIAKNVIIFVPFYNFFFPFLIKILQN